MKKTLITAVSALLISAGGASAATFSHADHNSDAKTSYSHVQQSSNYNHQVNGDITSLEEYAAIASAINPANFTTRVAEDNAGKRVILFSDNYGRTQYKSVFVKKMGLLKVINLKGGGVVLEKVVKKDTVTPTPEVKPETPSNTISSLPEYNKLAAHVDLTKLTPAIVTDNSNKRILLLKDANGREQYKSILIKRTSMLKIINLKGGQIYYGTAQ